MPASDDWRRQGQERYLKGAALRRSNYAPPGDHWDHDHCAFCWAKLMAPGHSGALSEGYVTADRRHWICPRCFEDFREEFQWRIANGGA
ncbi:MAG: hypothetical protein PVF91_06795 [Chromatiales bacterium]|jgi:hypothetical protein